MEEITIKYYQITLKKIIEMYHMDKIPECVLHHIPEINFDTAYYYTSPSYRIVRSISNLTNDFHIPTDIFNRELKTYLMISNANLFPEAILRFRTNILENDCVTYN